MYVNKTAKLAFLYVVKVTCWVLMILFPGADGRSVRKV